MDLVALIIVKKLKNSILTRLFGGQEKNVNIIYYGRSRIVLISKMTDFELWRSCVLEVCVRLVLLNGRREKIIKKTRIF